MSNWGWKILAIAGVALFLAGVAIGFGANVFAALGDGHFSKTEFPLSGTCSIAVDEGGRIYVGDEFYSRVQRYSPTGQFELGWFAPTHGAAFAVRVTAKDRVEIATARRAGAMEFGADGKLLQVHPNSELYEEDSKKTLSAGPYVLSGFLMPQVVDRRTGRVIVKSPFTTTLIAAPFPAIAYCGLGAAGIGLIEWLRRRARRPGSERRCPYRPSTLQT